MNLGKILSSFAKHYKPGHGGFALNKPVNSNGVTEQSYAGVQVPMQNQAGSQFIKNADPQSNYRTRMNIVEGNPLNFIGDMGTKPGGTEPVSETSGTPVTDKFYPGEPRPGITEEMLRQDRERRAASRQDKVFDARTGEELTPERRAQILKDVAIKAAQTGQSGDYATDGTFLGDSSGSSGSEVDGGTDWDTWSREVDAGLRTPPFVSSPGWEAARRRQYLFPMATRPRVVPNATGNVPVDPVQAYPAQGQGVDGAYPTEMSPAEIAKPMSGMGAALAKTKSEISRREGKDFRKGGADYDKDHDFKDVLRSFGIGALQSLAQADPSRESLGMMLGRGLGGGISGGIGGALDRNADEKMGNKIALGNLYQDYAKQLGVQDAELGISKKQKDLEAQDSIIRDRETDNQRQQSELERKIAKDEATNKYWTAKIDQGKIRLAQNEELIAIRDRLAQSKDKNDQRRLDLVEKEMENRNMRAESDRLSREKIAGMQESGRNTRSELARGDRLKQWAKQNSITRAQFQAALKEKVTTGALTQEEANAALADFDN